jgi:hypothetical protein
MKSLLALVSGAMLLVLTGCAGYHVGASVPKRLQCVKTIAVPTFRNDTLVPNLESLAASTVVKQFQQDGTFRVCGTDEADAILTGRITKIQRRGARSVRSDIVKQQEYYLDLTFNYTITQRTTGEELDSGTLVGETSFFVSGNDINQDERQAIPLAIEKAAVRLVNRVTTGW